MKNENSEKDRAISFRPVFTNQTITKIIKQNATFFYLLQRLIKIDKVDKNFIMTYEAGMTSDVGTPASTTINERNPHLLDQLQRDEGGNESLEELIECADNEQANARTHACRQ